MLFGQSHWSVHSRLRQLHSRVRDNARFIEIQIPPVDASTDVFRQRWNRPVPFRLHEHGGLPGRLNRLAV